MYRLAEFRLVFFGDSHDASRMSSEFVWDREVGMISLREVTRENLDIIVALSDGVEERLVAPNSLSIVEWLPRDDGWLQAIYEDEAPAGLVVVQDIPDWSVHHVWRLMIGNAFQRRGYGDGAGDRAVQAPSRGALADDLRGRCGE
jgi:hypothetical protein